jgi:hypothetical protein
MTRWDHASVDSDRTGGAIEFVVASPRQLDDVLAVLDDGAVILGWAAGIARERGRESLRLDCVTSNERLRVYYEAAGFVHRGDVTVAGAPGQRLDEGPMTGVSRYELQLPVAP